MFQQSGVRKNRMETVRIVKMGINGEGIAYLHHKPVFVTGAFPEETAEIRITEETERYAKAEAVRILSRSKARRTSPCPYADTCGACALIGMHHDEQCRWKKTLLEEALYKYGNVSRDFVREVHSNKCEEGYRTQCKMPVQMSGGILSAGLYSAGSNHFHPVDRCLVQDPLLEKTRKAVLKILQKEGMQAFDQKKGTGLRYLVIRTLSGRTQCTLITGQDAISENTVRQLMEIESMASVFQSINTERKGADIFGRNVRCLAGDETLETELCGIRLSLSPRSFFQLNAEEAEDLYRMAVSKIDPCGTLVEAYCGVGAMSLLASDRAKRVIGIESIAEAVSNAEKNAAANGIVNASFICADAAEGLTKILEEQPVDTLLADPPRSGMDDAMIRTILSSSIRKIIYVSCNPATLARNLKELKRGYQIMTVIPFDLFPNTPHIESITVLQRIGTPSGRRSKHRKRRKK